MGGGSVDLSGKLVLVTGATRGIGRAVAIAAAAAGAELIITGRTVGALKEADDAIRAVGGRSTMVELDMKDTPAIPRLAAAIAERWERLTLGTAVCGRAAVGERGRHDRLLTQQ